MPIYAAGPRPATMTLAPTSRRCIKHTLDRYLPLRSSTTKQRNSADPAPQIIARIASGPVSPDSSRAQISIAPARHRPTFPDRGFLPWRLSDAGRRCTWHRRVRPASETLHNNRLMHCSKQTSSFDRLVGAGKKRLRQFHAESIGGLQVDDKIELRGLRHRQIGWFRTLEDAAGIDAHLAI